MSAGSDDNKVDPWDSIEGLDYRAEGSQVGARCRKDGHGQ